MIENKLNIKDFTKEQLEELLDKVYQTAVERNGGWDIGDWNYNCDVEYGWVNYYAVLSDSNYKILEKVLIASLNMYDEYILIKEGEQ
jgi:hypothetical protein